MARFDLVVRVVLDGVRGLASAGARQLAEAGLSAAWVPGYAGAGDERASPVADRLLEEAAQHCARGEEDRALDLLEEASRSDPKGAGTVQLDLLAGNRVVGQLIVQAQRRAISVLAYPDLVGDRECFAVLKPADPRLPEKRAKLQPVAGATHLLAEFEGIEDGGFSIGLELLPQ